MSEASRSLHETSAMPATKISRSFFIKGLFHPLVGLDRRLDLDLGTEEEKVTRGGLPGDYEIVGLGESLIDRGSGTVEVRVEVGDV